MCKKKTNEEFLEEINSINSNIKILTKYSTAKEKVHCKCLIDDYEWWATPTNLLSGKGCPKCGGSLLKTNEDFMEQLSKINSNIIILGEYVNSNTHIKCKCLIDGCEWFATPHNLLRGKGCPICGGSKKLSQEEFEARLMKINPDIEVIGKYINNSTKIKVKCKKCDYIWESKPCHLLDNHGCPHCHFSLGEDKIESFLITNNIKYTPQKRFDMCKNINTLPFDFYLEDFNVCIEYDGKQHYEPIEYFGGSEYLDNIKKTDNIKNIFCEENDITLIRISYKDFNNIEGILEKALVSKK